MGIHGLRNHKSLAVVLKNERIGQVVGTLQNAATLPSSTVLSDFDDRDDASALLVREILEKNPSSTVSGQDERICKEMAFRSFNDMKFALPKRLVMGHEQI